jgi:hypothetical protein
MSEKEFAKQRQEAMEQMREMNSRSKSQNTEPSPTPPPKHTKPQSNSFTANLQLPFLDKLLKDSDAALIIGLLLLLMSEKADKRLLFALIYILL